MKILERFKTYPLIVKILIITFIIYFVCFLAGMIYLITSLRNQGIKDSVTAILDWENEYYSDFFDDYYNYSNTGKFRKELKKGIEDIKQEKDLDKLFEIVETLEEREYYNSDVRKCLNDSIEYVIENNVNIFDVNNFDDVIFELLHRDNNKFDYYYNGKTFLDEEFINLLKQSKGADALKNSSVPEVAEIIADLQSLYMVTEIDKIIKLEQLMPYNTLKQFIEENCSPVINKPGMGGYYDNEDNEYDSHKTSDNYTITKKKEYYGDFYIYNYEKTALRTTNESWEDTLLRDYDEFDVTYYYKGEEIRLSGSFLPEEAIKYGKIYEYYNGSELILFGITNDTIGSDNFIKYSNR